MGQATDNTPLIRIEHAGRVFRMGEVEVAAVADADLSIAPGELIVVLGPSGSGKSTLLNLIGAMDRPTSGRVLYGNLDLTAQSEPALTDFRRRKLGFIFQFYNLVPTLTARENVQVASELVRGALDPLEALGLVGLADRAEHFPAQLSGGEQQRVAIARALAKKPELLLADEPTGALDLEMAREVLGLIQRLNRERGLTTLIITHNPAIARIASRIIRIVSGHIAESRVNDQPIAAHDVSW
ncbi:MAG TPA: ABC transporter ATP-binding protein [Phycisphaerae bacterium]|nr:ABC transporter ATP-binding protein [Phycisphaerales bacterium]HRX84206.1 ABC transporter ATP-binding protein [Phycisphaerae bacterium]